MSDTLTLTLGLEALHASLTARGGVGASSIHSADWY
jgi:hypothetical protein